MLKIGKTILSLLLCLLFSSFYIFASESSSSAVSDIEDVKSIINAFDKEVRKEQNEQRFEQEIEEISEKQKSASEIDELIVGNPIAVTKPSVYRGLSWQEASLGFGTVGNCWPIAAMPVVSLRATDVMSVEVGAGAGYRDFTTKDEKGDTKDSYTVWFAEFKAGFTLHDILPHFTLAMDFTGVFQGYDCKLKGKPTAGDAPFFDGRIRTNLSYSRRGGVETLPYGWGVYGELDYYTQRAFSCSVSSFYGTPIKIYRDKNGKYEFGSVFTSSLSFSYITSYNDTGEVNNFFRKRFKFSVREGTTIEKPYSFYWTNKIQFSGPKWWQVRLYGEAYIDTGFCFGPHYYNKSNNNVEFEMSFGLKAAIGFFDYFGLYARVSFPFEVLSPGPFGTRSTPTFGIGYDFNFEEL